MNNPSQPDILHLRPAVTLLVPVYKVERYVEQCAVSLFEQTYPALEYVFLSDNTPDRSMDVLQSAARRYPERLPHVRFLHHAENKGIGAVRQALLAEVRTPFFAFVDSDDRLPLDAVETLAERQRMTDADIVEGAYCDWHGGRLSVPVLPSHCGRGRNLRQLMCQNIQSNRIWGKLYRADLLRRVPALFVEGNDYSEDLFATTVLMQEGSRAYTDAVVYHYRTDNIGSYTKNVTHRQRLSYLRSNRRLLHYYRQRGHLPLALEIGLLNSYRECVVEGMALQEIDGATGYYPEHLRARLLWCLLRSNRWHRLGDILYRAVRASVASVPLHHRRRDGEREKRNA